MIFPELLRAAKQFFSDKGEPLSLGLKQSFDLTIGVGNPRWYLENGFDRIAAILMGGAPSWSGETVSRQTALQNPIIFACNKLVSESVGFTPAYLMRRIGEAKEKQPGHPMYSAMLNAPNDEISADGFTELLTSHCLLDGGGFARIVRRSATGTAIELQQLIPEQVNIDREKSGQKRLVYQIFNEHGAADKTYTVERGKPHDILHLRGLGWDGIRGYSVMTLGRNSIGSAIAADRHLATFWASGGRGPYLIERSHDFVNDEQHKEWRAKWESIYSTPSRPPIVTPGTKYVPIGTNMRDAQGIENRLAVVAELCRWFDVSPPLVHDLSRATFSNIEELFLAFVKLTLARWLNRWEQDFWRCVLTPEEKAAGYFLRHNIRELLRGDFKTRMEGYASALQNGHLSIDEVRDEDDRNPLPKGAGSHYHIQTNMGTLAKDGQVIQPDKLMRVDQEESVTA